MRTRLDTHLLADIQAEPAFGLARLVALTGRLAMIRQLCQRGSQTIYLRRGEVDSVLGYGSIHRLQAVDSSEVPVRSDVEGPH